MSGVFRAGSKAGSIGTDAVMNLKSLKALGNADGFFKNLDNVLPSTLQRITKADMTDILKGLDDAQLAKIGKKLDVGYVKELDPQLAAKLQPDIFKVVANSAPEAGGAVAKVNRLSDAVKSLGTKFGNSMSGFKKKRGFGTKQTDEGIEALKNGEKNTTARQVEVTVENVEPATVKEADATVRGTKEGKEGLMKTGLYVTGGVVFAMMLYDTLNPFEAVQKAVKETGQTVRGLKEVAEEAAEAAVDLTKGGFNFVSFVTKNSGLSSACSILCLILIVAMVMLSFMSGGKNK
jgi:hypothetical protein